MHAHTLYTMIQLSRLLPSPPGSEGVVALSNMDEYHGPESTAPPSTYIVFVTERQTDSLRSSLPKPSDRQNNLDTSPPPGPPLLIASLPSIFTQPHNNQVWRTNSPQPPLLLPLFSRRRRRRPLPL